MRQHVHSIFIQLKLPWPLDKIQNILWSTGHLFKAIPLANGHVPTASANRNRATFLSQSMDKVQNISQSVFKAIPQAVSPEYPPIRVELLLLSGSMDTVQKILWPAFKAIPLAVSSQNRLFRKELLLYFSQQKVQSVKSYLVFLVDF